jgi:elongation factor Ts
MSETIAASLVKELRDLTGAGMMDCKRALEETCGDVEKARTILREKGMAQAGRRAGQETKEGKVLARVDERVRGAMVAVGCQTEPVARNEQFLAYAQNVLDVVYTEGPEAAQDLEEERVELVARINENIVLRGVARFDSGSGEVLAAYIHPPAEKIGALVRARASAELARQAAMHIAASRPRYVARDDVPEDEVATERRIYERLPEVGAKPEHIRPQIVEGMLAKRFFAEAVLEDQPWIHDDSKTVGQVLREHDATVHEFVRFALTE